MKHLTLMLPGIDKVAGAEGQAILIAKAMVNRGWRVSMIVLSGSGGAMADALMSRGIDFHSLHMRHGICDPAGWFRLCRWLGRNRPDVLHAHLPHATYVARWSRLFVSTPRLIDTIHTCAIGGMGRRLGYRASRGLSEVVTAVSQEVAQRHCAAGSVTPGQLKVIPNGIVLQDWCVDPALRMRTRGRLQVRDEFVWLTAGRLEPVKNHSALIEAFRELPRSARLVLVGDGSLRAQLEMQARSPGLAGRIHFVGNQSDVRPWMLAADAFVLPSLWEGLPMTLLEAAACRLPAVAADVPGIREILVESETGVLAAGPVPTALAQSMLAVMGMAPAERLAMGLRARMRVEAHFDLEKILDLWEAVYRGDSDCRPPAGCYSPAP